MNMSDPLPSWNGGTASSKETIIEFVTKVTTDGSGYYVAPENRIATFDNDGTLWSERPRYFQEYFVAPDLIDADKISLASSVKKSPPLTHEQLLNKTAENYLGISTEQYIDDAKSFLESDEYLHPTLGRKFTALTYQPLIELLIYLRAHQFKIYICSGGGRDFVRALSPGAYEIPTENVIGSSIVTSYDPAQGSGGNVIREKVHDEIPEDILADLENGFENINPDRVPADKWLGQYNDKEGKPVGIQRQIGKRPIMAVGNSTGDLHMFNYTDQGVNNSLIVLINHDDAEREFKYNDGSGDDNDEGNESLDKAQVNEHWIVVSMEDDFKTMFISDVEPV